MKAGELDLDDRQIMQRVQAGEHELFNRLAERYQDRLWRFAASKLCDATRAEDVVQEALLAAFASRHTYDRGFAFSTWLWSILVNLCRREMRGRRRRPTELSNSVFAGRSQPRRAERVHCEGGLSQLLLAERREQVTALLGELPDVQADALRLRFYGELQYDEIARTMNCSVSGAKRRVRTGLLALARKLDESGQRGEKP